MQKEGAQFDDLLPRSTMEGSVDVVQLMIKKSTNISVTQHLSHMKAGVQWVRSRCSP